MFPSTTSLGRNVAGTFDNDHENGVPEMIKCVQRRVMRNTGAIPIVDVETGEEEMPPLRKQKRAKRLLERMSTNTDQAKMYTGLLMESYSLQYPGQMPDSPVVVTGLRHMFDHSQDTEVGEKETTQHRGHTKESAIQLDVNKSDDSDSDSSQEIYLRTLRSGGFRNNSQL